MVGETNFADFLLHSKTPDGNLMQQAFLKVFGSRVDHDVCNTGTCNGLGALGDFVKTFAYKADGTAEFFTKAAS